MSQILMLGFLIHLLKDVSGSTWSSILEIYITAFTEVAPTVLWRVLLCLQFAS